MSIITLCSWHDHVVDLLKSSHNQTTCQSTAQNSIYLFYKCQVGFQVSFTEKLRLVELSSIFTRTSGAQPDGTPPHTHSSNWHPREESWAWKLPFQESLDMVSKLCRPLFDPHILVFNPTCSQTFFLMQLRQLNLPSVNQSVQTAQRWGEKESSRDKGQI